MRTEKNAPRSSWLYRLWLDAAQNACDHTREEKATRRKGKGGRISEHLARTSFVRRQWLVGGENISSRSFDIFRDFGSLAFFSLSPSLSFVATRPSYEDVDVTCASVNTHWWIGLITAIGYKSSSGHPRNSFYSELLPLRRETSEWIYRGRKCLRLRLCAAVWISLSFHRVYNLRVYYVFIYRVYIRNVSFRVGSMLNDKHFTRWKIENNVFLRSLSFLIKMNK